MSSFRTVDTDHDDSEGFPDLEIPNDAHHDNYYPFSKTIHLNISARYQPMWGGKEAFREIWQNCRDAIVESNKLTIDQLNINLERRRNEILITIRPKPEGSNFATSPRDLLGYVSYKYGEDNEGVLQIANFKAKVHEEHLKMGCTTKANKSNQAGQHGEGLKLAALIFRRRPQNYSVRCGTNSHYLNFKFNDKLSLVCRSSSPTKTLDKLKAEDRARRERCLPREATANIWEDVVWEIGTVRKYNGGQKTSKIPLVEFEQWLSMTLDIAPPTKITRTPHGFLILDEKYAGKVYLRNLLLPNASSSGLPYSFGYNFLQGKTNRDRGSLSNPKEEAKVITNIWTSALLHGDEETRKDLLHKYTLLLRNHRNTHADVNFAESYVPPEIAKVVWKHFLSPGNSFTPPALYYCEKGDTQDVVIIQKHLQKKPVPLPEYLWNMFRKFKLCRTPVEERLRCFERLEAAQLAPDFFIQSVYRALKACLQLHPTTRDTSFIIVDGKALNIDVVYSPERRQWKVDKKLFTFAGAHEHAFCHHERERSNAKKCETPGPVTGIFLCDHAVIHIYSEMIESLSLEEMRRLHTECGPKKKEFVSRVWQLLPTMPRGVGVETTAKASELKVSWEVAESRVATKLSNSKMKVTLHRNDVCRGNRNDLLLNEESCTCPSQEAALTSHNAIFTGLDPHMDYYPMVSRNEPGSIFGTPPAACKPMHRDMVIIELDDNEESPEPNPLMDFEPGISQTPGNRASQHEARRTTTLPFSFANGEQHGFPAGPSAIVTPVGPNSSIQAASEVSYKLKSEKRKFYDLTYDRALTNWDWYEVEDKADVIVGLPAAQSSNGDHSHCGIAMDLTGEEVEQKSEDRMLMSNDIELDSLQQKGA